MKTHTMQKLLALAALASLAACSGGGSTVPEPAQATTGPAALTAKIVGVGDSLTAGYQAGGFLGQFVPIPVPNPNAGAPVPIVPPGQESGWWSLLYEQATGSNWLAQANPATSVLPLIAGTGLGNQLITTGPGSPLPFASLKNPGCQLEDQAGFSATQWTATRQNPNTTPLDVAVPGITMHEAVAMNQPLAPTCATIPNIPPSLAGLITVVNGESALFNPVLGNFESLGQNRTMLNAAVSLKPTLATVWLGANDLLKFSFSGGQFCAGNDTHLAGGQCALDTSGSQVQADMTTIITTLQKAGAKVVVANLPNVLKTPQFATVAAPPAPAACVVQTYLVCVYEGVLTPIFIAKHDPNAVADAQAAAAAITTYVATTYGLAPNGYLTETGAITALEQAIASGTVNVAGINLDPGGKGSGLGSNYLTPAFAAQVQSYNDTINSGITAAASANGAPLVDIRALFDGIASGSGQYFAQAASINPAPNPSTGAPFTCCSLAFGFGLLSYDGLHPSNTGYALVANAFIQTIDTAFNAAIPPVNAQAIYQGRSPGGAPFPDPYAPH